MSVPEGLGSFDATDIYVTAVEVVSILPLEGPIEGCLAVVLAFKGDEGSPGGQPVALARVVIPAGAAVTLAENIHRAIDSMGP